MLKDIFREKQITHKRTVETILSDKYIFNFGFLYKNTVKKEIRTQLRSYSF